MVFSQYIRPPSYVPKYATCSDYVYSNDAHDDYDYCDGEYFYKGSATKPSRQPHKRKKYAQRISDANQINDNDYDEYTDDSEYDECAEEYTDDEEYNRPSKKKRITSNRRINNRCNNECDERTFKDIPVRQTGGKRHKQPPQHQQQKRSHQPDIDEHAWPTSAKVRMDDEAFISKCNDIGEELIKNKARAVNNLKPTHMQFIRAVCKNIVDDVIPDIYNLKDKHSDKLKTLCNIKTPISSLRDVLFDATFCAKLAKFMTGIYYPHSEKVSEDPDIQEDEE